ncbi:MAG TPA: hypothetical protein VKG25_19655 [Bryobacteraceae bacterium]|nr:hypothetical protein [Bryobacteraceae bacterium]
MPNAQGTDPYTPLLEAYVNDHVQIRTLVGVHTQSHALQIHGVKWLFEPDKTNSGWRNSQLMGLSEHFEYRFDLPGTASSDHSGLTLTPSTMPPFADYLYAPSSDIVGLNNGLWGIMRAYGALLPEVDGRQSLQPLPNNPNPTSLAESRDLIEEGYAAAPKEKQRNFDVTAVAASALPGGLLVYNAPKLKTAQAVLYFQTEDLDFTGGKVALKKDRPLEPLILRAAAGDWIRVTLRNAIPSDDPAVRLPQTLPCGTPFSGNIDNPGALPQVNMLTSALVGLHPQLVAFNPIKANGVRVGFNKNYLLGPGPNPNPQPGCRLWGATSIGMPARSAWTARGKSRVSRSSLAPRT